MKRDPALIEAALADLDDRQLRRRRQTIQALPERGSRIHVVVDGRPAVDFCSNDYLGLACHPQLAAAMRAAAERCGAGSGASHLVTGHGIEHQRLEEALAEFTGRERALLFSTGYMANLAVMTTFAGRGELALLDRMSHSSLLDGAQLSGARWRRFAHADALAAERLLATHADSAVLVATDGVFSMDGDLAPLPALVRACHAHRAWLAVDDAHGLGVIGATGRGVLEHFGLNGDDVPLLVGTLGKAFGSFGAFVAGSAAVIDFLLQRARPYIYTTALPQPVAAATTAALAIAEREPWRRQRLAALTARFRGAARQLELPLTGSETPIQPLLVGGAAEALRMQAELLAAGFWVVAIRPPTVPQGTARLRITLSAAHTEGEVDALLAALSQVRARSAAVSA